MTSTSSTTRKKVSGSSKRAWKPRKQQLAGAKFILSQACGVLWADLGVGKTSLTLKAVDCLLKAGQVHRVLVVAPLRPAQLVWPAEKDKWDDFRHMDVALLHGPKKDAVLAERHAIDIINPEGIEWLFRIKEVRKLVKVRDKATGLVIEKMKTFLKHDLKWARSLGYDMLVVDEIPMYKSATSRRFKALKPLLAIFSRRYGLTGTPATNGLMDLFGQVYVVDQGRTFGQFITGYRREYFTSTGYGGYTYELQPDGEKRIYKALKPIVKRLDNAEYLRELPELIDNRLDIDMPPKARQIYREMEKTFFTAIDERAFVAANAAVASGKCRQIASGALYQQFEEGQVKKKRSEAWTEIHTEKVAALEEVVESLQGKPLLIAYEFGHELERLRKAFGKDLPVIAGGTTFKQAKAIESAWNRGELPLLAGQPQAMGHGLNMQEACCHIAWFTLPWDLAMYDQLIGRVRRQGNPHKRIFNHLVIAKGTIEEAVLEALGLKGTVQQRLLAALTSYRRKLKAA